MSTAALSSPLTPQETQILALPGSVHLLSFSGPQCPHGIHLGGDSAPRWLRLGWREHLDGRIPGPPLPPSFSAPCRCPPRSPFPARPGRTCAAGPAGLAGPRIGRAGGADRSGLAPGAAPGAAGPQPREGRGPGVGGGDRGRQQQQQPEQQQQPREAARHGVRHRVATSSVGRGPGPRAEAADLKVPRPTRPRPTRRPRAREPRPGPQTAGPAHSGGASGMSEPRRPAAWCPNPTRPGPALRRGRAWAGPALLLSKPWPARDRRPPALHSRSYPGPARPPGRLWPVPRVPARWPGSAFPLRPALPASRFHPAPRTAFLSPAQGLLWAPG